MVVRTKPESTLPGRRGGEAVEAVELGVAIVVPVERGASATPRDGAGSGSSPLGGSTLRASSRSRETPGGRPRATYGLSSSSKPASARKPVAVAQRRAARAGACFMPWTRPYRRLVPPNLPSVARLCAFSLASSSEATPSARQRSQVVCSRPNSLVLPRANEHCADPTRPRQTSRPQRTSTTVANPTRSRQTSRPQKNVDHACQPYRTSRRDPLRTRNSPTTGPSLQEHTRPPPTPPPAPECSCKPMSKGGTRRCRLYCCVLNPWGRIRDERSARKR